MQFNYGYFLVSDLSSMYNFSILEGYLPFKLSSSFMFYKVFFLLSLLCLHLVKLKLLSGLLYTYLIMWFFIYENYKVNYCIDIVDSSFSYNVLLSENINSLHPTLLYLSFLFLLVFLLIFMYIRYCTRLLSLYKALLPYLVITLLSSSSLFFGMWWAQIEGS